MYNICYNINRSILRFVYDIINYKSGAYSGKRADASCRVITVFHEAERERKRTHHHAYACTCTLGVKAQRRGSTRQTDE